jgi:hypothetical protein
MNIQQLLTICGIVIFTMFTLTSNSARLKQTSSSSFNEAILVAADLGQSLIEEIHSKAFDEQTVLNAIDTVIDLTSTLSIGYETGEGLNNYNGYAKTHGYDESTTFDDVDDYNDFSRDYPDKLLDNFNIAVKVYYVSLDNPSIKSNVQTFAKKVDITISNPYLTIDEDELMGTLKLSTIITY